MHVAYMPELVQTCEHVYRLNTIVYVTYSLGIFMTRLSAVANFHISCRPHVCVVYKWCIMHKCITHYIYTLEQLLDYQHTPFEAHE